MGGQTYKQINGQRDVWKLNLFPLFGHIGNIWIVRSDQNINQIHDLLSRQPERENIHPRIPMLSYGVSPCYGVPVLWC